MATMRWVPLESNPEVFDAWTQSIGLDLTKYSFQDVFGLDPDLLAMVPQPVLALLVLFPVTASYEAHRKEQASQLESDDRAQALARSMLYFKQTVGNACGSIGLLHAVANSGVEVAEDSTLAQLFLEAKPLSAAERGKLLESYKPLEAAHTSAAAGGQTAAPDASARIDLHFAALVPSDGHLIELDGRKTAPIDHGAIGSRPDDFLAKAADVVRSSFFAHGSEANMHQFSLIALSGVQAASA